MKQLREATVEALQQIQQLLDVLTPAQYVQMAEHSSSVIGAHVRHVVDHYHALQHGLTEEGMPTVGDKVPRINFNRRNRNCSVEREIAAAKIAVRNLLCWFEKTELEDMQVEVESEISLSSICSKVFQSNLSRELCYLINHTIHHAAYIKVIAMQLNVEVSQSVGIAPTTSSYLRAVKS